MASFFRSVYVGVMSTSLVQELIFLQIKARENVFLFTENPEKCT